MSNASKLSNSKNNLPEKKEDSIKFFDCVNNNRRIKQIKTSISKNSQKKDLGILNNPIHLSYQNIHKDLKIEEKSNNSPVNENKITINSKEAYKKLLPKAKELIEKLKKDKTKIQNFNISLTNFLNSVDKKMSKEYICKNCFLVFKMSDNNSVNFFI